MILTKQDLRKILIDRRMQMTDLERSKLSMSICDRLTTLDVSDVKSLHFFSPIQALGEVNVLPFIESLKNRRQNIKLYSSEKIDGVWEVVDDNGEIIRKDVQFDVIIVPMLGFDIDLQRIGYGGGYYDRLLSKQRNAFSIGVCFGKCLVDKIPKEAHDVALNRIITEANEYS